MANDTIDKWFYVQTGSKGRFVRIDRNAILYIESAQNYLNIVTNSGNYLTYLTLKEIEEKLPACFMRVHKAFIIHLHKISVIEANTIVNNQPKPPHNHGTIFPL